MKLHAPKIPYTLEPLTAETFFTSDELDGSLLYAANLANQSFDALRIYYSVLKQCDFSHSQLQGADLTDVRFENCDFSNATIHLASIHRAQFINCKFVGTKFVKTSLSHVQFEQCMLTMASFESCKMEYILFHQSTLQQLDIYNVKQKQLLFDHCDLTGAQFGQTTLNKVDFSKSYFEHVTVAPNDLKGCIISREQAVYFAGLLGVIVKE